MKWLPRNPHYHRYDLAELERGWQAAEKAQEPAAASDNQQAADETQKVPKEDSHAQNNFHRRVNCSWLWTQTTINWDGSVSPCCAVYDPSFDFDTLSETSFKKVWNNEKYRASRRFSSTGEAGGTITVACNARLPCTGNHTQRCFVTASVCEIALFFPKPFRFPTFLKGGIKGVVSTCLDRTPEIQLLLLHIL